MNKTKGILYETDKTNIGTKGILYETDKTNISLTFLI